MTSEYRMNQSLNPYENLNFEPGLDEELAEMMGLEDDPASAESEPIGPTFEADELDLDSFFDDYQPSCRIIHTGQEDMTTEAILADIKEECERWIREDAADFKGFDDFDPDFGMDPDPEDCIPWEDFLYDVMDMRVIAEENLKLHFDRLEAEALLELDCTSDDVSWYAGSVLKHLSLMKRAGAMLQLLPTKKECTRTLDMMNGMEA